MIDINQLRNWAIEVSNYGCTWTKRTILTYDQVRDLFDDIDDIFDMDNICEYYNLNKA